MTNCRGDLKKKLSDFKVVGIYEYDGKSKPKKPLSGDLVPIIKKEDYDSQNYDTSKLDIIINLRNSVMHHSFDKI